MMMMMMMMMTNSTGGTVGLSHMRWYGDLVNPGKEKLGTL